MNVPFDYMKYDFTKSFEIYNNLAAHDIYGTGERDDERVLTRFYKNLRYITGLDYAENYNLWKGVDFGKKAREYLRSADVGLTEKEINKLYNNLAGK